MATGDDDAPRPRRGCVVRRSECCAVTLWRRCHLMTSCARPSSAWRRGPVAGPAGIKSSTMISLVSVVSLVFVNTYVPYSKMLTLSYKCSISSRCDLSMLLDLTRASLPVQTRLITTTRVPCRPTLAGCLRRSCTTTTSTTATTIGRDATTRGARRRGRSSRGSQRRTRS